MRKPLSCFFTLLALWVAAGASAQQRAQYSQYMLNPFVLNPAVAGLEDFIDVRMGYRAQSVSYTHLTLPTICSG